MILYTIGFNGCEATGPDLRLSEFQQWAIKGPIRCNNSGNSTFGMMLSLIRRCSYTSLIIRLAHGGEAGSSDLIEIEIIKITILITRTFNRRYVFTQR